MEGREFTLVPVLVGALDADLEKQYGSIFARYLDDPANLFVISSDFCHWGRRFGFTYVPQGHGAIHKGIEHLDKQVRVHVFACLCVAVWVLWHCVVSRSCLPLCPFLNAPLLLHTCMACVFVCACVCLCVYALLYCVCMHVGLYVCVCMYHMYVYIYINLKNFYTYIYVYIYI